MWAMHMETNVIIHGDCLDVLRELPDDSIDSNRKPVRGLIWKIAHIGFLLGCVNVKEFLNLRDTFFVSVIGVLFLF